MAGKSLPLLVLCSLLTLTSIIAIYHAHQLPAEQQRLIQLCTYEQVGKYDYTAILGSNLIYNRSKLRPGEGILYTRITEYINTTFSYEFKLLGLNHPANITIEYSINACLGAPYWTKGFNVVPQSVLNSTGTAAYLSANYLVNTTWYEEIMEAIREETGTYARQCNLTISPEIHAVATTDLGTIDDYFTPSMKINFLHGGPEGDHISIEDTEHMRTGAIEQSQRIYLQWVMNQRYTAYAFSVITIPALAYTTWSFIKTRPKLGEEKKKTLGEIIEPFQEITIEIAEEPSYEGQRVIMKTLEGLLELADGLEKPVFHLEKAYSNAGKESTHTFYVLDGLVRYEYTITAPFIEEKAKPGTVIHSKRRTVNNCKASIVELEKQNSKAKRSRAFLRTEGVTLHVANQAGVGLLLLGLAIICWVAWLTWHDVTVWGKDISRIFFGPRTGEAVSLGIGMKAVHYLIAGLVLQLSGLALFLRKRKEIVADTGNIEHRVP